ncbi:MAG: peptidoglycan D,D-transpeptidase FtsI family protein [Parvularculaceae bacterium]
MARFRFFRKKPALRAFVVSQSQSANDAQAPQRISAHGTKSKLAERARTRISMVLVVFCAVFVGLGGRLAYVSMGFAAPAPHWSNAGDALGTSPRAEIVDRNGVLLAANLPMLALEVAGAEIWDARETARALDSVLDGVDAAELEEKLAAGRYVEVRADLTPAEQEAVFALGLPGVRFPPRTHRYYPQESLAAHVIGHTVPGGGGVMGLEHLLDARREPGPLVASIDIRAQQALEDELLQAMKTFSATAAWGGVIDVRTGEIIALASLPDFDPNAPGAAEADWRRNRATYDLYELGSAFKTFTAAAVLEAGLGDESAEYDASEPYRVADKVFADYHGENRILTFSEVVQHSSNIGAARMAIELGPERLRAAFAALGLTEALPIELAENRAPNLPEKWGPVETATVGFGHGISVTPLHLLAAYAAVVNGGTYRPPTFLKAAEARAGERALSPETSAIMRRVLRRVITDGTARQAEAAGYYPIGKTATAEKPAAGGYDRNALIASFIGAFPGYAPHYVVLVSLDNPKPTRGTYGFATAGWNAAPTFARLVARLAPILQVPPASDAAALAAFARDAGASAPMMGGSK